MELPQLTDKESAQRLFKVILEEARLKGIELREPPSEPTTCCGKGCNGCVWEGYYDAVVYWRDEALLLLE
ncbi:MAG TPA: oxidoreductase-like domain-containing protein [Aquabacterium sp.]|nr:oxidoreductase-like domain-containing protein [Aquabacterium sp.]